MKRIAWILIFLLTFFIGVSNASHSVQDTIQILLKTDTVDIEYIQDIDTTIKVVPEQMIEINNKIVNKGVSCYVRFKCDKNEIIVDLNSDWILALDGYYYYCNVLEENRELPLFSKIYIPSKYLENQDEFCFTLQIEAIQSKNFKVDFKTFLGWGDVEVEECENVRLGG